MFSEGENAFNIRVLQVSFVELQFGDGDLFSQLIAHAGISLAIDRPG